LTPEQQTIRYYKGFVATVGEYEEFRSRTVVTGPVWFGAPRWIWRQLAERWLDYRIHRVISPASVWLTRLIWYSILWGKIRYMRAERG
jgi:hypothetical protein